MNNDFGRIGGSENLVISLATSESVNKADLLGSDMLNQINEEDDIKKSVFVQDDYLKHKHRSQRI